MLYSDLVYRINWPRCLLDHDSLSAMKVIKKTTVYEEKTKKKQYKLMKRA